jgi:hypothetical protein
VVDNELSELARAFRSMSDNINRHLAERSRLKRAGQPSRRTGRLVAERTRELDQLLRFQQLIAGISTRFINIPLHDIDQATDMALGEIGQFMQVERCYLVSFSDEWLVDTVHEWCASGIQPTTHTCWEKHATAQLGLAAIAAVRRAVAGCLSALPATLERQELENHQVQSLFMLRIDHMGRPVGLFGCDMVSRPRQQARNSSKPACWAKPWPIPSSAASNCKP